MRLPLIFVSIGLTLGTIACGNDDSTSPVTSPPSTDPNGGLDLDGRTFLSTELRENNVVRDLVPGTRIRIGFADGSISISGSCNIASGEYRIDNSVLVTDALAMTEMACEEPRMAQDDLVVKFVGDRPAMALGGDTLTLTTQEMELTLLDREVADPDRPLVGTRWIATTIIDGRSASSLPDGIDVTLEFVDGQLQGRFGCNSGGGEYTINGTTITFGPLRTTRSACDEPQAKVESHVLSVLDGDIEFLIEGGSLTLTHGDVALGLSAEAD
jgi:heat shock protein HslJ